MSKTWRVSAQSPEEAVSASQARPADSTRVSDDRPADRIGYRQWYQQPIETLDVAWDLFHDREVAIERGEAPDKTPPFPSFVDLSLAGLQPYHLSLLFDMAITAYRDRIERSV